MGQVFCRFFVFLLAIQIGISLGVSSASARTYGTPRYENDPAAKMDYVFGEFKVVSHYEDPDFNEGLLEPSPLDVPEYLTFSVIVFVDKVNQRLRVYDRSRGLIYFWKISTARPGKWTPPGYFMPQQFSSDHYSKLYHNSPMPWTVFFNGDIATHGTREIKNLGKVASAGCVRLEPQRGRDLFHLIGQSGQGWVDKINRKGEVVYGDDGLPLQVWGYRTLIIVE